MARAPLSCRLTLALAMCACGAEPGYDPLADGASSDETSQVAQAVRAAPERAFAWSNQETGTFTPDPGYSFNGSGGAVTISNTSLGNYTVTFSGLSSNSGNYQVMAYGDDSKRCKVVAWGSNGAFVRCHNAAGQLANSRFVISYTNDFKNQPGTVAGFLWTQQATGSHTPHSGFTFNSLGQQNFVHHFGTGVYFAQFTGLNTDQGNAQVTAYGGSSDFCKLNGWFAFEGHTFVGVQCHDPTGAPKDSQFALQFVGKQAADDPYNRAFVWAEQHTNTSFYPPFAALNHNSLMQVDYANIARKMSTGRYVVRFSDFPNAPSTVMVSALGTDAAYCKPVRWYNSFFQTDLEVNCFSATGALVDSTFSAHYVHQDSDCTSPSGCVTHPHLVPPQRIQREDNPRLRGYGAWPDDWSVTGSRQSFGGSFAPILRTDPPAITGHLVRSTFTPAVSGTTNETYTPELLSRAAPWMEFPCAETCPHVLPPTGQQTSVPYWAPGLSLPADHRWVRVTMQNARGTNFPFDQLNAAYVSLDEAVRVVPIHVHVLRDSRGRVPSRYDALFRTGTSRQIATAIRQHFDQANASYETQTLGFARDSVSAEATKLRDPLAKRTRTSGTREVPFFGDDIFGQCNVQLRLQSVTFVRQSQGLEQTLLSTAEVPLNCRDQGFCTNSRAGGLANGLVTAFEGNASLRRGIHVIIGGEIWPDTAVCGGLGQTVGLACSGNRFVLVDAGGNDGFRMNTVFHEIGHILTGSSSHSDDGDNLMHASSRSGGLLTASQCTTIHQRAANFE